MKYTDKKVHISYKSVDCNARRVLTRLDKNNTCINISVDKFDFEKLRLCVDHGENVVVVDTNCENVLTVQ